MVEYQHSDDVTVVLPRERHDPVVERRGRIRSILFVKRPRGWFGRSVVVLGWLVLIAGATGVGLHYNTVSNELLMLAASFAPYLMLCALLALLILLLARAWRSALAATLVTAAALWSQLPMLVPDGTAQPGVDVAVMQSNLLFGNADTDAVLEAVRDNGIDVLTLEELTPEALARLDGAGLGELLPYRHVEAAAGGAGSGIFTRYPLEAAGKLPGFLLNNVRATMIHPERGPVAVFQFHPVPPNLNFDAWSNELRTIRDLLDQQPGQVIVGGDFNATFDHAPFRDLLRGRYADAGELLGVGAMPTWPDDRSWGPLLGLDRVLVAGGHATQVRSLTIPRSDHRAVVARLRL